MSSSAWADFLDARLRLVHEWTDEGLSSVAIALRLTPDAQQITLISMTPTEPPIPGCSRDRVAMLTDRCQRLEAELNQRGAGFSTLPPSEAPPSCIRALTLHPDAKLCGCQYWHERPRPGEHHPQCAHFPKP